MVVGFASMLEEPHVSPRMRSIVWAWLACVVSCDPYLAETMSFTHGIALSEQRRGSCGLTWRR